MAIDRFTKQEFEQALAHIHTGYEALGLSQGEQTYALPVTESARILVRSSIGQSGVAADTGDDSIRLFIEILQPVNGSQVKSWKAAGRKVDAYTTRVPGWPERMAGKITQLFERAKLVRQPVELCPECSKPMWTSFTSKAGKNFGRPFSSCRDCDHFEWLDTPPAKGDIVKLEVPQEELRKEEPKPVESKPEPRQPVERYVDPAEALEQAELAQFKAALKGQNKPERKSGREPNPSQKAVIEAGVTEDIRLMAPPGSGKTFVIEHRYQYLLDQGVDPANILVVTFSKKMADEMADRITATCPRANRDQISTIHAFCYRLITRWDTNSRFYGHSVPKNWEVKKVLDELIDKVWDVDRDVEDLPGYQEVLVWIGLAKYNGLTVEQSRRFYLEQLGNRFGEFVYQIRRQFDAWLLNAKYLLFDDMLFWTEQMLKTDAQFRTKWQNQFGQVIVDESQDTNYQAMRILVTLSLEPGQNPIYA